MDYNVAPAEDGQYVVTTVVGEVTRKTAAEFIAAGFAEGSRLGLGCHLVDLTQARNTESALETVHMQREEVTELEARHAKVCVALLVDATDRSHDLYVAIAQNSGAAMKLFWDCDEAISYLKAAAPRFNTGQSGSG